eukprot:gene2585-1604_t
MDMRGLAHFIRDIRATDGNKRLEEVRVEEELAKIRARFIDEGSMTLYDRKKYVCKLMFIAMLGYPITFGHLEGLKLMAEETASEKLIGYLSITVLLNENSPLMDLTTHTVYRDLLSGEDFNRGLALTAIANTGNKAFVEVMHNGVQDIVLKESTNTDILKRAILTLLCVFRKYPEIVDLRLTVEKLVEHLDTAQEDLVMACVSFIQGCISKETAHFFPPAVPSALIRSLARIINDKRTEPGNVYYGVPTPWLQVKVLRLLQSLPRPQDSSEIAVISGIVRKIMRGTEKVMAEAQTQQKQRGTTNRVNAMISILFEAVSLIIVWQLDLPLLKESVGVVGRFIITKRGANIRCIGLTLLAKLSAAKAPDFDYALLCKQYEQQIVVALHDGDVSLRLQALHVLVAMCNEGNAPDIVKELLSYLPISTQPLFRTKLVLSIAYLAEKYFERSSSHYIDTMLAAIADAGDLCPPAVVQRVVHAVVNNISVQKRAVSVAFKSLKSGKNLTNEAMIRVAAFFLGEYGCQIALNPESTPSEQVAALRNQLQFLSESTQAVVLHALIKMYNVYSNVDLRGRISKIYRSYAYSTSLELQHYGTEYATLIGHCKPALLNSVLEAMPPFDPGLSYAPPASLESFEQWQQVVLLSNKGGSSVRPKKGGEKTMLTLQQLLHTVSASTKEAEDADEAPELNEVFQMHRPVEVTAQQRQEMCANEIFFRRLAKNEGNTLYRDADIEISCEQAYACADARLTLTLTPRQDRSGISNASISVAGVDAGLLLECRVTEVGLAPGSAISPLLQMEFAGRSAYPFSSPPLLRVEYAMNGTRKVKTVALPILTTRFITPLDPQGASFGGDFAAKIKERATPLKAVCPCPSSLCSRDTLHKTLLREGYSVLHYRTEQGADEDTVEGIGVHTTSPATRLQCSPVLCELCLLRAPASLSMTVYATSPTLQEAVLTSLQECRRTVRRCRVRWSSEHRTGPSACSMQRTLSLQQLRGPTLVLLKRGGKPTDTPDYKQVYLPYDVEPTAAEQESARRKLSVAYHGRCEHKKLVEVKTVPNNVYTYGKEGMSIPISIFKDQADPVIGPEWTYPGIYENKIVSQHWYTQELFDREKRGTFESPWQQQVLDNQVKRRLSRVARRMALLNLKAIDLFQKERGGPRRPGQETPGKEKHLVSRIFFCSQVWRGGCANLHQKHFPAVTASSSFPLHIEMLMFCLLFLAMTPARSLARVLLAPLALLLCVTLAVSATSAIPRLLRDTNPFFYDIFIRGLPANGVIVGEEATIKFYGTDLSPDDSAKIIDEDSTACESGAAAGGVPVMTKAHVQANGTEVYWAITVKKEGLYRMCYRRGETWTEVSFRGGRPFPNETTTTLPPSTLEPEPTAAPDSKCPTLPEEERAAMKPLVGLKLDVVGPWDLQQFTTPVADILCIPWQNIATIRVSKSPSSSVMHWYFVISCPTPSCDAVERYHYLVKYIAEKGPIQNKEITIRSAEGLLSLPFDVHTTVVERRSGVMILLTSFFFLCGGGFFAFSAYKYRERQEHFGGADNLALVDGDIEDLFPPEAPGFAMHDDDNPVPVEAYLEVEDPQGSTSM